MWLRLLACACATLGVLAACASFGEGPAEPLVDGGSATDTGALAPDGSVQPGCGERALSFHSGQFVIVSSMPDVDPAMSAFTVEAWFLVLDPVPKRFLLHHEDADAGWTLFTNNSSAQFRVNSIVDGGTETTTAGNQTLLAIAAARWVHFAAVFDGTRLSSYVNGVRSEYEKIPGVRTAWSGDLTIGAASDGTDGFLGMIDEVRISSVPRYLGETFSVPTGRFAADANTMALWHFDESDGPAVLDSSGAVARRDGTLGAAGAAPTRVDAPCIADRLR